MKKFKILTTVGTRPEIIRLSRVIDYLNKNTDHKLVHTGQNYDYELNEIFFKDLGIKKPNYQINIKGKSLIKSISEILSEVDVILEKEKPDAFLVLGDTNSCLTAYCAKRKKIPIFHIEAGNRCYDQKVPEEINRKIIDHISDINITYSEIAKDNLLRENIAPDKVFKIGSPLQEVFNFYKKKILNSKILKKYKIKKNNFYLLSVHREENIDNKKNFSEFINLLEYLIKRDNKKIIVSTHPRTMNKIREENIKDINKVIFAKPFSYSDYCNLQINSKVVLSDSGSITEESNIMKFNAINLRDTNERQEGMSVGAVAMAHFNIEQIENLITLFEKNKLNTFNKIEDYDCPNFSTIFYKLLLSYTQYVNKHTWKK
tara:strand:+ start:16987 stop:18105 length:1119 start_codon:yes stop_codon:yes gene_type:complete